MLRRCKSGPFIRFHPRLAGVDDQKRKERRIMAAYAFKSSAALFEV
jgi:hypothetical protein